MTTTIVKSIIRQCGFHHCYGYFIHNVNNHWKIEMDARKGKISLFPTKNNIFNLDDEMVITHKINKRIVIKLNEKELLSKLENYFQ